MTTCVVFQPMLPGFETAREIVQAAVRSAGLELIRLEDEIVDSAWHAWLLEAIAAADIVLADVSANNGYVMYELGCAQGAALPVVHVVDVAHGPVPASISGDPVVMLSDDEACVRVRDRLRRVGAALYEVPRIADTDPVGLCLRARHAFINGTGYSMDPASPEEIRRRLRVSEQRGQRHVAPITEHTPAEDLVIKAMARPTDPDLLAQLDLWATAAMIYEH